MGYGSFDKPVPWLGPHARIVEVHWPGNKFITIEVDTISAATGNVTPGTTGTVNATPLPVNMGVGYITGAHIRYPPPPSPPYPPYPPPKIRGGRQARAGDGSPDELDAIASGQVTFTGMPTLPDQGTLSLPDWTTIDLAVVPAQLDGRILDFRVPGQAGQLSARYREGTSVTFLCIAKPFSGPLKFYGNVMGAPNGTLGRPLSLPSQLVPYSQNVGPIVLNFGSAIFVYKTRNYRVLGRYVAGPYTPPVPTESGFGGKSVFLLCESVQT